MRAMRRLQTLALAALAAGCARGDLRSPSPERRAAAVASLSGSRDEADWPALLVAQDDPSPLVRKAAAGALTARAGPRAVEALGKLARDPDPGVATAAARGLAAMPQESRVRPLLVEAWWQGPADARAELAAAIEATGALPREAVALEARRIWERNSRALAGGSPASRAGAAEDLGRSGRTEAVQMLLPLLESDDPGLAAAAARGLGHARQRKARPALEELLDAPDAEVAEAAAGALGEIGDPRAADALGDLARGGPERLAAAAVEGLAALPLAPEVGVALCEVALRSPVASVAARAAREARLRDADCPERPLLARLGRSTPDLRAALAAAAELRLPPERLRPLAERIASLVAAPGLEPASRAAASTALGRLGWAAAAPVLAKRIADLRADPAPGRRPASSSPSAPGPGTGDGADSRAEELAAACLAAARLRADGAEAVARALAADPRLPVRAAGAEALGALGGGALADLVPLLGDSAPAVRLAAARGLGRPGSPGAEALARAAAGAGADDPEWQRALARALGETGWPGAVAALGKLLDGPAAAEAAEALEHLGAREGAPLVEAYLAHREGRGRAEAVSALASLEGPAAGPRVARELWSDRPAVRVAAARVVGRLRYEPATPWLEALRSDYSGEVRLAAVEALAKMPTGRAERR
jgi:HEAT repeat protein